MDRERFENLLARHFDGMLSPEETAELGSLLQADAELREAFWTEAQFHALVRRSLVRDAVSKS
ncbi:MAG: hypothetical protein K8T25_10100, partial [Planctomycetia bacterium]|nr:hypothetical protein [Planctomycetia bacterium]